MTGQGATFLPHPLRGHRHPLISAPDEFSGWALTKEFEYEYIHVSSRRHERQVCEDSMSIFSRAVR